MTGVVDRSTDVALKLCYGVRNKDSKLLARGLGFIL